MAKRKVKTKTPANDDGMTANPFRDQHGQYGPAFIPDPTGENRRAGQKLVAVVRKSSILESWFKKGGVGFDTPQLQAAGHVQHLWRICDTQAPRVTANYQSGLSANVKGGEGREVLISTYVDAIAQLAEYQKEFPHAYWVTFERIVRDDVGAALAGSHLGRNDNERVHRAHSAVGMILSKISEWRGF